MSYLPLTVRKSSRGHNPEHSCYSFSKMLLCMYSVTLVYFFISVCLRAVIVPTTPVIDRFLCTFALASCVYLRSGCYTCVVQDLHYLLICFLEKPLVAIESFIVKPRAMQLFKTSQPSVKSLSLPRRSQSGIYKAG